MPVRRLEFRLPHPEVYEVQPPPGGLALGAAEEISGYRAGSGGRPAMFTSRLVLQLRPGVPLEAVVAPPALLVDRVLPANVWILQAPDAWTAATEADRLAAHPDVRASYPVMRRDLARHNLYAARPNDTYFSHQWNLENRRSDGLSLGADLNVRAAWPFTRGEGVTVAVADDGIDLLHPELGPRAAAGLHFYFGPQTTNGLPSSAGDNHGTAVAGLIAAEWHNRRGMAGVAPAARLASWKIWLADTLMPTTEQMMDMFQYRSNVVAVQNHSWGNAASIQYPLDVLEDIGISNAVMFGRQGRGVVMVRSCGNGRADLANVNDDGYASDPRVIAVGAVRADGRVTSYSNPGACLLVSAPGGDDNAAYLLTTDRRGSAAGFNTSTYTNDFADYVESGSVIGTSFTAPQISGLVALLLAANPALTYRDVQLILALSSRHVDPADPDLRPNGAGLPVSHNAGFGVPDAGLAVDLARRWVARPPLMEFSFPRGGFVPIPDDGLRVRISGGAGVPAALRSMGSTPSTGSHADAPTASLPLVDVGRAAGPIGLDLTGKAALIQRGLNEFGEKIAYAASAGAAFAVVYNNVDQPERVIMDADFAAIPAVMISRAHGEALKAYLQANSGVRAEIGLEPARYSLPVTTTLSCEHVGLWLRTTHTRRGDVRVTLVSPAGTRSVLQRVNADTSAGPVGWTYYSVQHFLESSAGTWVVEVGDEAPAQTGSVTAVELILRGVSITDADHDGLDDGWEAAVLGTMSLGARDDPDGDGYSNAVEQVLHTNPRLAEAELRLDITPWSETHLRLSWLGVGGTTYEVLMGNEPSRPSASLGSVPGRFPTTEWFAPRTGASPQYFRLRSGTSTFAPPSAAGLPASHEAK
jgi:subtilisin family serine protease